MTAADRLTKVKIALGISGDFQNDTINFYIDEVMAELIDAGVAQTVVESDAAVGCIALGVNDLWNFSSGGVVHSEQFNRRLIQLSVKSGTTPSGDGGSYNDLTDLPSLNGTTLQGDLESDDVGIEEITNTDVNDLF